MGPLIVADSVARAVNDLICGSAPININPPEENTMALSKKNNKRVIANKKKQSKKSKTSTRAQSKSGHPMVRRSIGGAPDIFPLVDSAKKAVAKKTTAAKKTVARKTAAAKKAVVKKASAAKKTFAKKSAAKKAAAKKTAASKAAAKKTAASKAAAKKTAASKAAAKKAAVDKKSAAKKSVARSIKNPPRSHTEVKDGPVTRKFLSTAASVKGLQMCSTWKDKKERKKKPNTSHFLMTIDDMVRKPSTANKSGFWRDEAHTCILHPEGFSKKAFAKRLKLLAEDLEQGKDKYYTYTQEVDEYKEAIYGGADDSDEESSDEESSEDGEE